MDHCKRCQSGPSRIPQSGILCLSPPLAHTLGTVRQLLDREGIAHTSQSPALLSIPIEPGLLARLVDQLDRVLSRSEAQDTRSLIHAGEETLTLAHLMRMQPLATLIAQVQGEWFSEMLHGQRFTTFFQPIVHADEPWVIHGYECLLRGQGADGQLVPPTRLYNAARDGDMMFQLDRSARLSAIRSAVDCNLDQTNLALFINFNPTSVYDPTYCLRSTVAAIRDTGFRPESIVFEIVESDHIADIPHLVRIVDYYRESGFRIALDDLGAGYASLNLLGLLKPDLVKLDMELIRGVDQDPFKGGIVRKVLEMSRDLEIKTVAEGIETRGEFEWVRENGADFAQGYYIARPAGVPPTVLDTATVIEGFQARA